MLIVVGVLLYLLCLGLLAILGWEIISDHYYHHQGITYGTPPHVAEAAVNPFGVNVSLERYERRDLERALTMIRDGGFHWVRQRFPWAEMEPEQGEYDWDRWDRIVAKALEHELSIIAVLEGSPSWARAPMDGETAEAPPRDFADLANFAKVFASHYRKQIDYYEIWDQPNLYPHWGERYTDPTAYTHLLQAGYGAIKEGDPEALVLTAGLAPNVEEGGQYMSDLLFLQKMYEAGAREYFDILAVKPYGLWYEPGDRRLSPSETNFSRPVLLREVMLRHGDGDKAVWAVEFGWCALPSDWTGRPAPWTSDREDVQARRTVEAIQRARDEWPWMGVMALQHFHPVAEPDDPIQGFSLITDDFAPRLTYQEVRALATDSPAAHAGWYPADTWAARYEGSWTMQDGTMTAGHEGDALVLPFKGTRLDLLIEAPFHLSEATIDGLRVGPPHVDEGSGERRIALSKGLSDEEHVARLVVGDDGSAEGGIAGFIVIREASFGRYYLSLLVLAAAGVVVVWRLGRLLLLPRSLRWWRVVAGWYLDSQEWQQVLIMALTLAVYYFSPWTILSLVGLAGLIALLYLRLDLGLAMAVFSIPFFLRPKIIAGQSLSLVEMLTILCFATWLLREVATRVTRRAEGEGPLTLFPHRPLTSLRYLVSGLRDLIVQLVASASSLDLAILFFLAVSIFSLTVSENFGVSLYELRTVVVGPVILYLLVREGRLDEEGLLRLVDALILAAVVLSLYGLSQYFFTGDIITAEGVRRIRAVYG
ncbi:MAG: beta-galactosidase, partial [Anaerolineae bacterium]